MSDELKEWLTQKGYSDDLNRHYQNGDTPLIVASREGNINIVREILKYDININALNNDNTNALWASCFANNLEIINELILAGIDINNQNVNGATSLIYASSAAKEEIVELLLKHGADKSLTTLEEFDALSLASTPKILKLLK